MYTKKVIDIFENLKCAGNLKGANGNGKLTTQAEFGEIIKISIKADFDNFIIEDAKFRTVGSVATIVCCEVLCEMIKGKTIESAMQISGQDIILKLDNLPALKVASSIMAVNAFNLAVKDFTKKREKYLATIIE